MSPPRAPHPADPAVFAEAPRRSGLITLAIHGALFAALALMSRHPRAREVARAASVVEFDAPPPRRAPPPPEPPAAEAPPPPPPEPSRPRARAPTPPSPAPEPPPVAAPPPILTAAANAPSAAGSVPSGTNTRFRGGDTASAGHADEGARGERAVPPPAPPPPPTPTEPVNLPDEAAAPEPLDGNEPPAYPDALREAGVQGTVIARFVVRADGSVGEVRALRGPEELRETVQEALRRWRFRPATLNGHAIAVFRTMPFRFVLDNL